MKLERIGGTKYHEGTDITAGLRAAEESDEPVVVLITDEQANLSGHEMEVVERISRSRSFVLVNPSPYPVHVVGLRDHITYLPAANPEGLIGALKLNLLKKVAMKENDAHEIFVGVMKEL